MIKMALLLYSLLFGGYLLAQKNGADRLDGYIVRAKDTIAGKVVLPHKMNAAHTVINIH
jgi:hypothetical protein